MLDEHADMILTLLRPTDKVLDIGGWARPFNRANYVLDAEAYESRGYHGVLGSAQGGPIEHFTKDTWIQRDICSREPFPFADKAIDFVICSHTLEDVRDPLWVCSEMTRIAKAGYIEVPSRIAECCRGIEPGIVGWSHHRWLVTIRDNDIEFLMKYHMIHRHWRFSFPRSFAICLPDNRKSQWLLWKESFTFHEKTIHGVDNIARELEEYIQQVRPYPIWLVKLDSSMRRAGSFLRRGARGIGRRLPWRVPNKQTHA